eukprot:Rmarinus@m.14844
MLPPTQPPPPRTILLLSSTTGYTVQMDLSQKLKLTPQARPRGGFRDFLAHRHCFRSATTAKRDLRPLPDRLWLPAACPSGCAVGLGSGCGSRSTWPSTTPTCG